MEQEQKKSFFQNVLEKASYIGNLSKDVVLSAVRGLARESGALTLWLKNKITGGKEEFVPQNSVSKLLFGDEPLQEKNPIQVAKDAINFVGDITWRPFTRAVGKIGLSAIEKITGEKLRESLRVEKAPLPGLYRFVFGEEPLSPLEMEWQRYKEWGRKHFGEQWGDKLGTLAFLGFLGLDLWIPIGGGAGRVFLRKEILRDIAKSTDKKFIKDTLLKELPELHHPKIVGRIDGIAEKLVGVNKPSAVRKVLQSEFDNIAKEMGIDLAKIRKEMMETDFKKTISEMTEKAKVEGIKEPPIPPRPPQNPPLDNLPFRPEFNPKGGEYRVHGFFRNLWENKPEFRERVSGLLEELSIYYEPIKNREIIERAVAELMQYETLDEAFKKIGRKFERTIPRDPGRLATEIVKNVLLSEAYWEAGMKVRSIRIMNNVIGLYGEIGRALQTARFTPRLSPAYLAAWAPRKFTNALKEMAEQKGKVLSDEFLNDIEQKIRRIFRDIEVPAEKERALMELINKEIAPQLPLTFWEGLNLYRYGNMLSGPVTHLRNIWGNVFQLISKNFFVLPVEIVVEYVRHPHNPALRFSDLPKIWKQTIGSIGLAYETAVKAFSSGEVSTRMLDFLKGEEDAFKAMVNFARYNNAPLVLKPASAILRFMEATDKFFATLVAEGEKYRLMEQAKRAGQKITKSLERQIMEQAQEVAEEYFFRRNLGVGREKLNHFAQVLDFFGEKILQIRNEALESKSISIKTFGLGLSMLVPFIRTPINIAIAMLEHSPLGIIRPIDSFTSEKLAQVIVGSIFTGVVAWLAFNNRTTWLAPKDPKERAIFYENRKPFSINIPGTGDVPLLYFGPYGVALAVPAALKWALTERKPDISPGLDEALAATALETLRFIMSQTSLEGLTRLGRVLSGDEDWKSWAFVGGHLGQYIPLEGFLRMIAKITDPVYRKTGTDFWGSVKADIPFLRQTLEAYENIGGESDFAWWQAIIPYATGKESMPFSLALKELQIDRRRREAWRLYAKDKLRLEDINAWVERAKIGFRSDRKLTEQEIEEGMRVFEALKTYEFKDRNALDGALYFATIFLEQLKKEGRRKEFERAVRGLPKEYVRKIKKLRKKRKELEQLDLPIPLPLDLANKSKKERAEILHKFFKDIKGKVSEEEWYRIQRILKEKKILTKDVVKEIRKLIAKEKGIPITEDIETGQQAYGK